MKILYQHRTLADGAEGIHIREMVEAFRANGHEVVVCAKVHPNARGTGDEGFWKRLKTLLPGVMFELAAAAASFVDYVTFSRELTRHRPDFVYKRHALNDVGITLAARHHRIPLVLEVNRLYSSEAHAARFEQLRLRRFCRFLERMAINQSSVVAAVSTPLTRLVREMARRPEKVMLLPNGANPVLFQLQPDQRAEARAELGWPASVVVGWAGILREWHGVDMLLRAVARVPGLKLLIIGDGPDRARLESIIGRLGLDKRVRFTGRVSHDEVVRYIGAVDIAVAAADSNGIRLAHEASRVYGDETGDGGAQGAQHRGPHRRRRGRPPLRAGQRDGTGRRAPSPGPRRGAPASARTPGTAQGHSISKLAAECGDCCARCDRQRRPGRRRVSPGPGKTVMTRVRACTSVLSLSVCLLIAAASQVRAQQRDTGRLAVHPGHPRLFFTADDLPALRDRIAKYYHSEFQDFVNLLNDTHGLTREQAKIETNWAGFNDAFVAVLDPEEMARLGFHFPSALRTARAYCDKAMASDRALLPHVNAGEGQEGEVLGQGYPDPKYLSVVTTYDWCYSNLADADRQAIVDAYVSAYKKKYDGRDALTMDISGLPLLANQRVSADLDDTLGIVAFYGDAYPDAALQGGMLKTFAAVWLQRLMGELNYFYRPATGWHEGPGGYLSEAFVNFSVPIAMFSSALGRDYIAATPFFSEYSVFAAANTRPHSLLERTYYDRWGTLQNGIGDPSCKDLILNAGMLRRSLPGRAGLGRWMHEKVVQYLRRHRDEIWRHLVERSPLLVPVRRS